MGISCEKGFELVDKYVRFFISRGEYNILLKNGETSIEDIVSDINLKFLESGYYKKWNANKAGLKYYISLGVKRKLIDMSRTYKERISLDNPDKDGLTLMERLDNGFDTLLNTIDSIRENELLMAIENLPEERGDVRIEGYSPVLGKCCLSMKIVAVHLIMGYKVPDIAKMFINPHRGKPVSNPTIYNIRNELREYLLEC
ncbi:MAG: hypothetical protein ACOCRO_05405 [Halanaerobiales bacterium]